MIVHYSDARPLICEGVRLIPGKNDVKEAVVKKLLLNPLFRYRIDKGLIIVPKMQELLEAAESEAMAKEKIDPDQVKINKIENHISQEAIQQMTKKEKSSKVIEAAEEKLEKLKQAESELDRKFNAGKYAEAVEPTAENGFTASVSMRA